MGMQWWQAVTIGLVQGLTEFLPVSSSGHLAISYRLLGLAQEPVSLSVALHLFTILAVFVYFWSIIRRLKLKYWVIILIASVPAAFVGVFFRMQIQPIFSNLLIVGALFSITALANIVATHFLQMRKMTEKTNYWSKPTIKQAVIIGLAQSLAVLPGVSRSAMTITTGLVSEGDRRAVFNFSFLLSIPVIIGAFVVELFSLENGLLAEFTPSWIFAGIVAFASGLLSLKILAWSLKKASLAWFGMYTLLLSGVVIWSELF